MEKSQHVDELCAAVDALKEKCHNLEMQNYSLQLHLKQATGDVMAVSPQPPKNPDVF